MLEARIRRAVDSLLAIEHRRFGARVGLLSDVLEAVPFQLIKELAYSIDELSWSKDEHSRRFAVQVIALTWEHISEDQQQAMRDLFVTSLARVGVSPSIAMLEADRTSTGALSPLSSYAAELASSLRCRSSAWQALQARRCE